jgi:hypothetical protein
MASADRRSSFYLPRLRAVISSPIAWALLALWLLLVAMEMARPCYFLHDDNANWFIGAYLHDFNVLAETGRVAEVNYFQHAGEPFLEQSQTAVLYPPVYPAVFLAKFVSGNVRTIIDWIAAEHLTLGLLGFYFWMRQGGVASRYAALGAVAWALNPFVLIVGASWIFTTYVVAWLPWIFWALDRVLAKPSGLASFYLGVFTALLFLQGYAQYFAYAVLFMALYAGLQFVLRPAIRQWIVFYYLLVSALIFAILALPLLLPLLHAVENSAARSEPLPLGAALFYCASPHDLFFAQLCLFQRFFAFGASTVVLYCPALLLAPAILLRLFYAGAEGRRRLIPLLLLGVLALIFSSSWHWLLTVLPVFDKFRWPFKVDLLADFYFIAALVWTASSWTESRSSGARLPRIAATACLALVAFANFSVSLAFHDDNFLSQAGLPASVNPLLPGMDPRLGRVVTFADGLPERMGDLFYTRAFATYFGFPSLGGYNPLVSRDVLTYANYLDYPNICTGSLTREFQQEFEALSVRYWFVDPHSSQFAQAKSLPGLRVLEATADRVVFEDTLAAPLAFSTANPSVPCAMAYSGNSILIPLAGVTSPVSVSTAPGDGWWYRIDRGPWLKPVRQDDRLLISFAASERNLEITYFDPRFWRALRWSAGLVVLTGLLLVLGRRIPRRDLR